jgi:hypothetical protein
MVSDILDQPVLHENLFRCNIHVYFCLFPEVSLSEQTAELLTVTFPTSRTDYKGTMHFSFPCTKTPICHSETERQLSHSYHRR